MIVVTIQTNSSTSGKKWDGKVLELLLMLLNKSSKIDKIVYIYLSYPHCRSIRLWKTFCEDEGVRAVTQFLQ